MLRWSGVERELPAGMPSRSSPIMAAEDDAAMPTSGPDERGGGAALPFDPAGLSALLTHVDEVIVACDGDGRITFASPAVRSVLGYDPVGVVGRNILEFAHPDEVDDLMVALVRWADRPGAPRGELQRVRTADGQWVRLHYDVVTGAALDGLRGLGELVITLRPADRVDVTRGELTQRLVNEDRLVRLASIFLQVGVDDFDDGLDRAVAELAGLEWITRASVWRVDGDRADRLVRRAMWEAAADAPSGGPPEHIVIADWALTRRVAALHEVHIHSVGHLPDDWEIERRLLQEWGVNAALAVPMVTDGQFAGAVLVEVTLDEIEFDATHLTSLRSAAAILAGAFARHDLERALARQARSDALTGLANRWAFNDQLRQALDEINGGRSSGVAVALVDIDRFKHVNDEVGHEAGDRLLVEVADRLRGAAPPEASVARLGGDEFLVLHTAAPSAEVAHARTGDILAALGAPFELAGDPVVLTASVGLVHTVDGDADPVELLRRAELAMYRAKEGGGDRVEVADDQAGERIRHRLRQEAALRTAIDGGGLTVHYQGEWDLTTDRLVGVEALARWEHPDDGLLDAGRFVPLAEESGLIDALGSRVLREACKAVSAWPLPAEFVLRVNLSAHQLRQLDLVDQVADALEAGGLAPERLCLELTESSLLADLGRSAAVLRELRDLGAGLAVDDFGTGFSSMLYLKRLPLTSLKIDRAFVEGLPSDPDDRAIVGAIVGLASSLGVGVTAEGVETEAQLESLLELGCTRAQGFLLARPEPAADFGRRLSR